MSISKARAVQVESSRKRMTLTSKAFDSSLIYNHYRNANGGGTGLMPVPTSGWWNPERIRQGAHFLHGENHGPSARTCLLGLRIGLVLGAFLAGLDKFFNILKVRMLSSETGSRATHA